MVLSYSRHSRKCKSLCSRSGEAFAENAHRIVEDEERRKKARGMWDLLLQNLPSLKEEDSRQGPEGTERVDSSSDTENQQGRGDVDVESQAEKEKASGSRDKQPGRKPSRNGRRRRTSVIHDKFKDDLEIWTSFFRPRKSTVWTYIKSVLFYVIAPLLFTAACLFYFGENPIHGISEDGNPGDKPSIAWWLIFIVRQVVAFSMALAMQGMD